MEWLAYAFILVCILALLLSLGTWITVALGVVGIVMLVIDAGGPKPIDIMGSIGWNTADSFLLTAIPLFIFMGEVILQSGVTVQFYRGISVLLNRVPGGLLHSNIVASAIFAAISGSSVANAAAIGSVALPEMDRQGYNRRLVFSSLAGGGTLGLLIPPSVGAIIYAAQVEVSVSELFLAGAVPGIILAILFSIYLAVRVLMNPASTPKTQDAMSWPTRLRTVVGAVPLVSLLLVVLGSIYTGIATPTEAAGLGAVGAILVSVIFGDLDWQSLRTALAKSVNLTCMIMFLIVGAQILSFAFVRLGIARGAVDLLNNMGLSALALFVGLIVFYSILGCFIDGISIMLLTIPVVFPIIQAAGMDPVWFGVVMMIFIELGMITPPVGLVLFVLHGIAPKHPFSDIVRAAIPVQIILIGMLFAMYAYPEIALWLPSRQ